MLPIKSQSLFVVNAGNKSELGEACAQLPHSNKKSNKKNKQTKEIQIEAKKKIDVLRIIELKIVFLVFFFHAKIDS
jgi:hypothetical protein